jgi:hypothetical protein
MHFVNELPRLASSQGAVLGDFAYFFGGEFENRATDALFRISLSEKTVEILKEKLPLRTGHSLTAVHDSLFLIGGRSQKSEAIEVWVCRRGDWSPLKTQNDPPGRSFHSASAAGDQIVVFGGSRKDKPIAELAVLDTKTGAWSLRGNSGPSPRFGHSSVVLNNVMYVYGGKDDKTVFAHLFALDLASWQWREIDLSVRPPARFGHYCFALGSHLVVIGGTAGDPNESATFGIDPATGRGYVMNAGGTVPQPLLNFGAVVNGDEVLIFGGAEVDSDMVYASVFVGTVSPLAPGQALPPQNQLVAQTKCIPRSKIVTAARKIQSNPAPTILIGVILVLATVLLLCLFLIPRKPHRK